MCIKIFFFFFCWSVNHIGSMSWSLLESLAFVITFSQPRTEWLSRHSCIVHKMKIKCHFKDLHKKACKILVHFQTHFFSLRFIPVKVVQPRWLFLHSPKCKNNYYQDSFIIQIETVDKSLKMLVFFQTNSIQNSTHIWSRHCLNRI